MDCSTCKVRCQKAGKHINGLQRYRCGKCWSRYTEPRPKPLGNMRVPMWKAKLCLHFLVEGSSIRSLERVTGLEKKTITRLLLLAAKKAEHISKNHIRAVPVKDVQADEIWGFVAMKRNTKARLRPLDDGVGDVWCFVAIDRETKLVLCWHLGGRTMTDAAIFLDQLDYAAAGRFQLTTDGLESYADALAFNLDLRKRVDYGQVIKTYGKGHPQQSAEGERRYSPTRVIELIKLPRFGSPDPARMTTSHVERNNLNIRMMMRRFTRLTNAFSKKKENLRAALALHFAYYNFCWRHESLRCTPTMAAGVTKRVWEIEDLLSV